MTHTRPAPFLPALQPSAPSHPHSRAERQVHSLLLHLPVVETELIWPGGPHSEQVAGLDVDMNLSCALHAHRPPGCLGTEIEPLGERYCGNILSRFKVILS